MKNGIFYLACLIFLPFQIFGQANSSSSIVITWDVEGGCSSSNSPEVKAAAPRCERFETDQGTFYIMSFKGISVAILYVFPRPYIRTNVQITNRSRNEVKFDPSESYVDVFNSKSAFLKGEKKLGYSKNITANEAKALYLTDQSKLKFFSPGVETESMSPADTALQLKVNTKTSNTVNGRTTEVKNGVPVAPTIPGETRSVAIEPQLPSVDSPVTRSPSKPNPIVTSSSTLFDQGISARLVPDQQKVGGYLFFELVKDRVRYLVFRIKVGNLVFVFPEETQTDKEKLRKKR